MTRLLAQGVHERPRRRPLPPHRRRTAGARRAAATAEAQRLATDTPMATSTGATFTAPAGWSVTRRGNVVVLDPPEGDSHLALVDVEAPTRRRRGGGGLGRVPAGREVAGAALHARARPRTAGRKSAPSYYETSPNEKMTVFALARRSGATLDRGHRRGHRPDVREAQTRLPARPREPAAQGLHAGDLRRAEAPRARRRAHRPDRARSSKTGCSKLDVPGLSFSLVQDGKVVHVGGLGVKELGKPAKVDADTLFIAASNTKALATLLLAKLADEGKLAWDQPVTQLYPAFKLGDAETTRQVLVKHLVCACTGLPRQDLEWIFEYERETPETAMRLLGTMQPTSKFGEVFQYSNLMAAAAGYVGGHLADPKAELGVAFDRAMRKKLLDPLGMKTTTFDFARALTRQPRLAPRRRRRREEPRGAAGAQLLGRPGAPRRRHLDERPGAHPVRPDGARERKAPRRPPARLGEEPARAAQAAGRVEGEDGSYGMGLTVGPGLGHPGRLARRVASSATRARCSGCPIRASAGSS